jgi:hypothetical protein
MFLFNDKKNLAPKTRKILNEIEKNNKKIQELKEEMQVAKDKDKKRKDDLKWW